MPPEISAGRAGRRLGALIELVESRRELSKPEFAAGFGALTPDHSRELLNAALRRTVLERPEERIEHVEWGPVAPNIASAYLTLESGDRIALVTREDIERRAGFTYSSIERIPAGVLVRRSTPSDGPALREIERTTPLDLAAGAVTYDKGNDYFALERLMGDVACYIIEVDGKPAGLFKIAERLLYVAGQRRQFVYAHRHRIAPWAQRRGLNRLISFYNISEMPASAARYMLIASDHRLAVNMSPDGMWSVSPERVLIDTGAHVGSQVAAARAATSADVIGLVDLFNDTHGNKELFVPYTHRTLSERLSRLPGGYSWGQIRLGDQAALGTWPADWVVTHTIGNTKVVDRRAIALDYGMREGAESELADLIRATCFELASQGITEISLFTTPGGRGRDVLLSLAKVVEPYRLIIPFPEPPDLATRGIYLDQVYL